MTTKTQTAQTVRQDSINQLREWIKPGDTVYTILRHVTRSGNASISAIVMNRVQETDGTYSIGSFEEVSYLVARALGFRMDPDNGGVRVGYMGERRDAALVHDLARTLHGSSTALVQREL